MTAMTCERRRLGPIGTGLWSVAIRALRATPIEANGTTSERGAARLAH
jgi:hypothetical protein